MGDRPTTFERSDHGEINILLSYHYFRTMDLRQYLAGIFGDAKPRVYLDSGAWSAFTLGATINLDEYVSYVHRYRDLLWTYCNLDDMKRPEVTVANQREMERQGLCPMPAFHVGEDFKFLDAYAEEYAHVAIGRIVPFTGRPKVIVPYLGKCFRVVNGRAKVHGLGVSNVNLLQLFPWATTDSSAWTGGFRFGHLSLFDRLRGGFAHFDYHSHRSFNRHQELLREHRFDRFNYIDVQGTPRHMLGPLQAMAYLKMNQWMRRRMGTDYKFFFAGIETDFAYVRDAAALLEAS